MKIVAFVSGLAIGAVGVVGIVSPPALVWIARQFTTAGAFYLLAVVRIAFGLVLISAAPASRWPRALRIFGFIVVIAGVVTAIIGGVAIDRARDMIDTWIQQGPGVIRLTSLFVIALGSCVAYACALRQ